MATLAMLLGLAAAIEIHTINLKVDQTDQSKNAKTSAFRDEEYASDATGNSVDAFDKRHTIGEKGDEDAPDDGEDYEGEAFDERGHEAGDAKSNGQSLEEVSHSRDTCATEGIYVIVGTSDATNCRTGCNLWTETNQVRYSYRFDRTTDLDTLDPAGHHSQFSWMHISQPSVGEPFKISHNGDRRQYFGGQDGYWERNNVKAGADKNAKGQVWNLVDGGVDPVTNRSLYFLQYVNSGSPDVNGYYLSSDQAPYSPALVPDKSKAQRWDIFSIDTSRGGDRVPSPPLCASNLDPFSQKDDGTYEPCAGSCEPDASAIAQFDAEISPAPAPGPSCVDNREAYKAKWGAKPHEGEWCFDFAKNGIYGCEGSSSFWRVRTRQYCPQTCGVCEGPCVDSGIYVIVGTSNATNCQNGCNLWTEWNQVRYSYRFDRTTDLDTLDPAGHHSQFSWMHISQPSVGEPFKISHNGDRRQYFGGQDGYWERNNVKAGADRNAKGQVWNLVDGGVDPVTNRSLYFLQYVNSGSPDVNGYYLSDVRSEGTTTSPPTLVPDKSTAQRWDIFSIDTSRGGDRVPSPPLCASNLDPFSQKEDGTYETMAPTSGSAVYRGAHGAVDNHLDISASARSACMEGKVTNTDGTVRTALTDGASCYSAATDNVTCATKYEEKYRGNHRKGEGVDGLPGDNAGYLADIHGGSYDLVGEVHLCEWSEVNRRCEAGKVFTVCPEDSTEADQPGHVIEVAAHTGRVSGGGSGATSSGR